jgi:uncharacterized protein YlzI (FlbEa/FlbD family)
VNYNCALTLVILDSYVIVLTSLNGQPLAVNSDLIKLVEGSPDTVLTLLSGEKLLVRESIEEVILRVIRFRRAILSTEPLGSSTPSPAPTNRTAYYVRNEDNG